MGTLDSLQFQVLDVLVNAPSSVAGIYGDLVYLAGYSPSVIQPCRHALDLLEERGWAISRAMTADGQFAPLSSPARDSRWAEYTSWLPVAERTDLALDEIGLWYQITEAGRAAWAAWAGDTTSTLWQLDDDPGALSIAVTAETESYAESILEQWLGGHPQVQVRSKQSSTVENVPLRSGKTMEQGVRIVCSYLRKPS